MDTNVVGRPGESPAFEKTYIDGVTDALLVVLEAGGDVERIKKELIKLGAGKPTDALDYLTADGLELVRAWETEHYSPVPRLIPHRMATVRGSLITGETAEFLLGNANDDLVNVLHELGDLDVVLTGTWLAAGLHPLRRAVSRALLESNKSKCDPATGRPIKTSSGRVLKGPNYRPADIAAILQSYLLQQGLIPGAADGEAPCVCGDPRCPGDHQVPEEGTGLVRF